eukprot:2606290-Rhodomonas_salina.1
MLHLEGQDKKSSRPVRADCFPLELWHYAPDCLLLELLRTINNTLKTGKMPDEWRRHFNFTKT